MAIFVESGLRMEETARRELLDVRGSTGERLQFRCENGPVTGAPVVQWLDTDGISCCEQFLTVRQDKCEHPVETIDHAATHILIQMQKHLTVTGRPEPVPY